MTHPERMRAETAGNVLNPKKALLLFHGRGSNAANIIGLTRGMSLDDVYVCAPDAPEHRWYPQPFMQSRRDNQPDLDEAHETIRMLIMFCKKTFGLSRDQVVLAGSSQGASLVADYVVRNPARYGGVCILSGGIIGNDTEVKGLDIGGSLKQTLVYLGCDKRDPYIPLARVRTTAETLIGLGANLSLREYDGLGHGVHPDGVAFLSRLVA
jgi:phospholipase/carboxylesterase